MTATEIQQKLASLADPRRAEVSRRFFKTGPGEYGEGDIFHGIAVPLLRSLCREYQDISVAEAERLLASPFHEDRLLALLLLVRRFTRGDTAIREKIYRLYLKKTKYINNWDLVDSSAGDIIGAYLWERDREPLYRLAVSPGLWERRIAIIATYYFIKRGDFQDTLNIAEMLLGDREDLIHKGVGWMLREVGNRDRETEEGFLREHYRQMPRTMLRYAIEKFPEEKRQRYLKGTVAPVVGNR
jgi:3-methyladenine DNA glycosylase AlkD